VCLTAFAGIDADVSGIRQRLDRFSYAVLTCMDVLRQRRYGWKAFAGLRFGMDSETDINGNLMCSEPLVFKQLDVNTSVVPFLAIRTEPDRASTTGVRGGWYAGLAFYVEGRKLTSQSRGGSLKKVLVSPPASQDFFALTHPSEPSETLPHPIAL
jgi:hypothetical protein